MAGEVCSETDTAHWTVELDAVLASGYGKQNRMAVSICVVHTHTRGKVYLDKQGGCMLILSLSLSLSPSFSLYPLPSSSLSFLFSAVKN